MKYYWKTKSGQKIDVDKMDVNHLRNVLKMLIRNNAKKNITFSKSEIDKLTNKDEDYDDWLWK